MDSFIKERAREQKMEQYTVWRYRLTKMMEMKYGRYRAEFLAVVCKVGFDVQPTRAEATVIVLAARKERKMPFVIISIN